MSVGELAPPHRWHADKLRQEQRDLARHPTLADRRVLHTDPFDTCPACAHARTVCQKKIPLNNWVEAKEWQDDFNETHGYQNPVVYYGCRWCNKYHLKTARQRGDLKKAERARRKWLTKGAPTR